MKTDTELQRDVLDELQWDPSFDAAEIGISAKDGIITLSGQVANFAEKSAAVRTAKRVSGVKAVADNIEVRLPSISERTDAHQTLMVTSLAELRKFPVYFLSFAEAYPYYGRFAVLLARHTSC